MATYTATQDLTDTLNEEELDLDFHTFEKEHEENQDLDTASSEYVSNPVWQVPQVTTPLLLEYKASIPPSQGQVAPSSP